MSVGTNSLKRTSGQVTRPFVKLQQRLAFHMFSLARVSEFLFYKNNSIQLTSLNGTDRKKLKSADLLINSQKYKDINVKK